MEHKETPDNGKIKFTSSIEKSIIKELKRLAINLERPLNDLIKEGITLVLEKYRQK